ncbi:hypothetical protein [Neobacillus mesonae]|nr:hypothetical protein [Neobacillus mesonae]
MVNIFEKNPLAAFRQAGFCMDGSAIVGQSSPTVGYPFLIVG